ncbi:MAG: transcriptional regulator [Symploca sp. SIO1B1]|nr:transcriptional regulator [Symploca sp. SIO1B1]
MTNLFKVFLIAVILIGINLASPFPNAANCAPQDTDLGVCAAPPNLLAAQRQASYLINQIRADLATVEERIRNVPFLAEVEAGNASLEQIASVAAEQYSIIRSDWSSFAQMTARFDDPQSRQFFGGIASGEAIALQLLLDFAESVGLDEQDLTAYEPRPKGQTYPSRVAWIAANANRTAAGASFLANFPVFGENMGRLRDALINIYGFSPEEVAFFSFFAEPIPGFEENAIEVIAAGLRRGACPIEVQRSARLLQSYELDFWQAVGESPGSPLLVVRELQQ